MRLYKFIKQEHDYQNEVFSYLELVKPKNKFRFIKSYYCESLVNLSYEDVDYVKRLILDANLQGMIQAISVTFGISTRLILMLRMKTFISLVRFIALELEKIHSEEEKLQVFHDEKVLMALEMSGASMMNQFSIYNVIDSLSKNDLEQSERLKKLPYHLINFKATKNIVSDSVNKSFQENYQKLTQAIK